MAKQRMVNTKFWSDPWIVDELNPLDRYLFLYLLTNEKTNIAGVYELSIRTMSNETGIEKEELLRMLKRLESRVVYALGWVIFRKAIKHQNYKSPKIEAAVARELKEVPEDALIYLELPINFGELLRDEYGIDTLSIPYAYDIALNLTKPNLTKPNLTKPNADVPALEKIQTAKIDAMFDEWESVVGMKLSGMGNRKACASLLREHGQDVLTKLIQGVAESHEDQYAPRISDFTSLKRKINDLLVWGRKRNKSGIEIIS
jgi:hypothetical protein